MNYRQKTAYFTPCVFASERENRIYLETVPIGGRQVSTRLTVQAFLGHPPRWVVEGWVPGAGGKAVNVFSRLSTAESRKLADYLRSQLYGVGTGDVYASHSITCFGFYRYLSENEISGLRRKAA